MEVQTMDDHAGVVLYLDGLRHIDLTAQGFMTDESPGLAKRRLFYRLDIRKITAVGIQKSVNPVT
jgi:hypothetical protein